jgi:hypothetical protein
MAAKIGYKYPTKKINNKATICLTVQKTKCTVQWYLQVKSVA